MERRVVGGPAGTRPARDPQAKDGLDAARGIGPNARFQDAKTPDIASKTLPTLLAISGSLRAASSNSAVVAAARVLAPPGLEVVVYEGLGDLPHFNPDLDTDTPPPTVAELRRRVGEADALLISSPEYAHGIPGVMKNALDWLVASLEFPGKPVGLINASAGSVHAQAALEEVLRTMSAELVAEACVTLPWTGAKPSLERLVDHPELSNLVRGALAALARRASRPAHETPGPATH